VRVDSWIVVLVSIRANILLAILITGSLDPPVVSNIVAFIAGSIRAGFTLVEWASQTITSIVSVELFWAVVNTFSHV
jgi:hypothetical protein